ncbi:MAG TPA: hypothetical protein VMT53_01515 [Terriglobales bacterium]|nr:hypothetical protein [Terriglobales bacterium]
MNTFDIVERHQRIRLLCHAIRHLLDHCPENVNSGDVEAIDILQSAINPQEDSRGLSHQLAGRFTQAENALPEAAETAAHGELEYAL